jgi:outer membrane lipoprotein SlyB
MRLVLAMALAVCLTGCGSTDWFGGSTRGSTTATAVPNMHCTNLAKQRAIDSAYAGEDPDTQRAVYERTYSDCIAWDNRHQS